jgi:hypothetical protein
MSVTYWIEYDDVTDELRRCQPGDEITHPTTGERLVVEAIEDDDAGAGVYLTASPVDAPGIAP